MARTRREDDVCIHMLSSFVKNERFREKSEQSLGIHKYANAIDLFEVFVVKLKSE